MLEKNVWRSRYPDLDPKQVEYIEIVLSLEAKTTSLSLQSLVKKIVIEPTTSFNIDTRYINLGQGNLFYSDVMYPSVSWVCRFELLDIYTDYKDSSYPDVKNWDVYSDYLSRLPGGHSPCMDTSFLPV